MPVIAGQGSSDYLGRMASAILRVMALIALVLMPLGMAAVPVGAATTHEVSSAPTGGHCDEHQKPADAPLTAQMHCIACAALAAYDFQAPVAELLPRALLPIQLTYFSTPFEPEISTPPPKFL